MGTMKKRVAIFVTALAMAATAVAGCGSKVDKDAVVVTIGEDKVTMGVANFFARYQQAIYEAQIGKFYGDNFWESKFTEEDTWEESAKENIIEDLKRMYVLEDHMKEYNVELTAEDNKKIEEAAKAFVEANGDKEKEIVSGDEETVKRVLSLITIEQKMKQAMIADVDTNVSDAEAAQKSMQYVFFPFSKTDKDGKTSEMTDEEKAELKKTAEAFVEGAKKAEDFAAYAKENDLTASTRTFDAKDTDPAEELIKVADTLEVGQVTPIIDAGKGYYVAKVTSLLDKEATEKEKAAIVTKRQSEKFTLLVKAMSEGVKTEVNEEEWAKVSFQGQRVTFKQEEKTEE